MPVFARQQKIMFQHCDPAGIVFYPRYFEMINETVECWFAERLDHPFNELHGKMGMAVPTVTLQTDFSAPSCLGDELEFRLWPVRLGHTSLSYNCEAWCGNEIRLQMKSTLVFISKATGQPMPWLGAISTCIEKEIEETVRHA